MTSARNTVRATDTIRDTRDMALTHKDFFRILPRAMGDVEYRIEGSVVTGELGAAGSGSLKIEIGSQQLRKIALMEVPWCRVEFTAVGVAQSDFDAFARNFHRHFQRGGG